MLTNSGSKAQATRSLLRRGFMSLAVVSAVALVAACGSNTVTGPDPVSSTPAPAATPDTTPTPDPAATPASTIACVPTLESPARGATMDNGRTDGHDELIWDFDWSDCPGADLYHLYVKRAGSAAAMIDRDDLAGSNYNHGSSGYVGSSNLTGWTWKVRARIAGQWGQWSVEMPFVVEPPNTDPPDVCVPTLISPAEGATLDNGRTDHTNNMIWTFNWSDCPGATQYHLYVKKDTATNPAIDEDSLTASYYQRVTTSYVPAGSLTGWTWKVRAKTDGVWSVWTSARSFQVEPPNTD